MYGLNVLFLPLVIFNLTGNQVQSKNFTASWQDFLLCIFALPEMHACKGNVESFHFITHVLK